MRRIFSFKEISPRKIQSFRNANFAKILSFIFFIYIFTYPFREYFGVFRKFFANKLHIRPLIIKDKFICLIIK